MTHKYTENSTSNQEMCKKTPKNSHSFYFSISRFVLIY